MPKTDGTHLIGKGNVLTVFIDLPIRPIGQVFENIFTRAVNAKEVESADFGGRKRQIDVQILKLNRFIAERYAEFGE